VEIGEQMGLDDRIIVSGAMQQDCDQDEVEAVFRFVNAFAQGDAGTLRPMMDPLSRQVLDDLVATGAWVEATSGIRQVVVNSIVDAGVGLTVGFGITDQSGTLSQQSWVALSAGDAYQFRPVAIPPMSLVAPPSNTEQTDFESGGNEDGGGRSGGGGGKDGGGPG